MYLFAEQQIEGYVEVNASDAKKGDYFLRIQGDSMEGSLHLRWRSCLCTKM